MEFWEGALYEIYEVLNKTKFKKPAGIPPQNGTITNIIANVLDRTDIGTRYVYLEIYFDWKNGDTILENQIISSASNIYVVRKEGSCPENINDGNVICVINRLHDDKVKENSSWSSNDFYDRGMKTGVTYYYRFFVVGDQGAINLSERNVKSVKITA